MKKILKICLVVLIALSLVACGGNNNSADNGSESEEAEQKIRVALVTNVAGNSAFIDDGIAGFKETAEK